MSTVAIGSSIAFRWSYETGFDGPTELNIGTRKGPVTIKVNDKRAGVGMVHPGQGLTLNFYLEEQLQTEVVLLPSPGFEIASMQPYLFRPAQLVWLEKDNWDVIPLYGHELAVLVQTLLLEETDGFVNRAVVGVAIYPIENIAFGQVGLLVWNADEMEGLDLILIQDDIGKDQGVVSLKTVHRQFPHMPTGAMVTAEITGHMTNRHAIGAILAPPFFPVNQVTLDSWNLAHAEVPYMRAKVDKELVVLSNEVRTTFRMLAVTLNDVDLLERLACLVRAEKLE